MAMVSEVYEATRILRCTMVQGGLVGPASGVPRDGRQDRMLRRRLLDGTSIRFLLGSDRPERVLFRAGIDSLERVEIPPSWRLQGQIRYSSAIDGLQVIDLK